MIFEWPLLASVTFNSTSPISHISGLLIKYQKEIGRFQYTYGLEVKYQTNDKNDQPRRI